MDDRDRERLEELPEHERRAIEGQTVGGGVMGTGGTVVDRGTGTLGDEPTDIDDEPIIDTPADIATLSDESRDD